MNVFVVYGGYKEKEYILQAQSLGIFISEERAKKEVELYNKKYKNTYHDYWYEEEDVIV